MKTYNTIFKIFFTLTFLIFCTSCEIDSFAESDEHSFGEIIAPTNIQISANIIGQDADNPNGDGSGKVEFTVTADNAITYKFINNGAESLNPSGKVSYTFTALGVNSYTITAVAVGSGGTTSSQNISVDVITGLFTTSSIPSITSIERIPPQLIKIQSASGLSMEIANSLINLGSMRPISAPSLTLRPCISRT